MVISAIIWKHYATKSNRHKVYIRISDKGTKAYLKTDISITAKQWKDGRVRYVHTLADTYNHVINELLARTERAYLMEIMAGRRLNPKELKQHILLGEIVSCSLTDYTAEFIKAKAAIKYREMLGTTLKNIKLFAGKSDI